MKVLAGAAEEGLEKFLPLIKLEIFRDAWQTLGMLFSRLFRGVSEGVVAAAVVVWSTIGNIIAIDWGEIVSSPAIISAAWGVLAITALVVTVMFGWFVWVAIQDQGDTLRDGHEALSWREKRQKEKKKVTWMTRVLTASLTIYMPLGRTCVEILYCDASYSYMLHKYLKSDTWHCEGEKAMLPYIAGFFLLFFVIPLPFLLAWLVAKNKPRGSPENPDITHDEDGIEVEFTDQIYHQRVEMDPEQAACPYRSLYKGFERKWAFYKIALMMYKLALVLPVIVLGISWSSRQQYTEYAACMETSSMSEAECFKKMQGRGSVELNPAQSGVTLAIVFLFSGFAFYSTPYIDPISDIMDAAGRIAVTCTTLIALLLQALNLDAGSSEANGLGIMLNLINVVNVLVMSTCFLYGFECTRNSIKNLRNNVDFSNTVTGQRFLTIEKALSSWDVEKEVKHRIWHAFWNSVLLNACGDEVAARMLELQESTRAFGFEKIKAHWAGFHDKDVREMREFCRQHLEGVDLFWDEDAASAYINSGSMEREIPGKSAAVTLDGEYSSETGWGKMYVDPYPFHMVVVYDDCDDVSFLWGEGVLRQFVELQRRPDVVERRKNRETLRALSKSQQEIRFAFSQWESHTVQDGTNEVTTTDDQGNTTTSSEPNMITVRVEMHYTRGTVAVHGQTDKAFAAGFEVSMWYNDGHGEAWKPKTCQMHHFNNMHTSMGWDHMGINKHFSSSDRLTELFRAAESSGIDAGRFVNQIHAEADTYRSETFKRFEAKKGVLHNGFWYYIYNQPGVEKIGLLNYFNNIEMNSTLKRFPKEHQAGLRYLYLRMEFVRRRSANLGTGMTYFNCGLWFVFWDDFWSENKQITKLQGLDKDFDPTCARCCQYYYQY